MWNDKGGEVVELQHGPRTDFPSTFAPAYANKSA